jgi:hypothetical protein
VQLLVEAVAGRLDSWQTLCGCSVRHVLLSDVEGAGTRYCCLKARKPIRGVQLLQLLQAGCSAV